MFGLRINKLGILGNTLSACSKVLKISSIIQNVGFIYNAIWEDQVGTRTGVVQQGRSYTFNGTDNYISTGEYLTGGTPINIKMTISPSSADLLGLFDFGWTNPNKGIGAYIVASSSIIKFTIANGSSKQAILTTNALNINEFNNVEFDWNGLIGGTVTITINGNAETFTATKTWSGNSSLHRLFILSTYYFKGEITSYSYTINNNDEVFYNCEETEGATSYSTTTGTTGTINGTLTNFHTVNNNQEISDCNNRGYGQDNGSNVIVPLDKDTQLPVISTDNTYVGRVKYNLGLVESNGFAFNGTDNYLQLNEYVVGGVALYINTVFKKSNGVNYLLSCGGTPTDVGIRLRILDDVSVILYINDGTTYTSYTFAFSNLDYNYSEYTIVWSGVAGDDMTISVDEETISKTISEQWIGNSAYKLYISYYYAPTYSPYIFQYFKYNNIYIPFSLGSGNKVYDVNSNTEYTILGTVNATNHILADIEKPYNLFNGFGNTHVCIDNEIVSPCYVADYRVYALGGTNMNYNYNTVNPISGLRDYKIYTETVETSGNSYFYLRDILIVKGLTNTYFNLKCKIKNNDVNDLRVYKINAYSTSVVVNYYIAQGETYELDINLYSNGNNIIFYMINSTWNFEVDDIEIQELTKYPQSKLNPTQDVLGNTLTNPAIKNANGDIIGHNRAETTLEEPLCPALYNADANLTIPKWFTDSDTANKVSFVDLEYDWDNEHVAFANIVDSTNDKRQLLLANPPLTTDEIKKVDKCYSKNIEGTLVNFNNGDVAMFNNGEIIEFN